MIEIDLGLPAHFNPQVEPPGSPATTIAGSRLLAHTYWPGADQLEKRKAFLARMVCAFIAALEECDVPQLDQKAGQTVAGYVETATAMRQYLIDHQLLPLGGFALLNAAPSWAEMLNEMGELGRQHNAVGWTLLYARIVADELGNKASLNRGVDLVEEFTEHNNHFIWESWKRFAAVAHISAAMVVLNASLAAIPKSMRDTTGGLGVFDGLWLYLGTARDFQKFGTCHIPVRSRKPILDPSTLWAIPEWLPLPAVTWPRVDLGPEFQEVIRRYKRTGYRY